MTGGVGPACGRFAPSPTGPLHFGSLVAALASCCDARSGGGRWLVRIEDVDVPRVQPGAEAAILAGLARFGMVGDGPILHQSLRTALYERALATLAAAQIVYPCACTRSELAALGDVTGDDHERVYPGTCRHGIYPARAGRTATSMRVRVDDTPIAFVDRVQGPQRQVLSAAGGDFVVRRSDSLFAYQLAVVVDDGAQHVTDVVRGADLLASTPRQLWLQQQLDLPQPRYLHVPVATNARGEKLSKQSLARALDGEPLPALHAAWQFLAQPQPPAHVATVAQFWAFALAAWTPARIPARERLPCPDAFG